MSEWISTAISSVSALASFGSFLAAWRQTRIVREERRWSALKPEFNLSMELSGGAEVLQIHLAGPDELERLDRLVVNVLDDQDRTQSPTTGGPTEDEVARQIWASHRFMPGVHGADRDGRSVELALFRVNDRREIRMVKTSPPPWHASSDKWDDEMRSKPLRLELTCERKVLKPWTLRREVPQRQVPRARIIDY